MKDAIGNIMFQELVGMVLFNPTDEDIDMQYSGVSFTLKAGEKKTFEAKCANHLLNSFGQRGLSYLAYGSDEEAIAAAGRERNRDFKHRMVTDFNVRNENRKNMGLGYHVPTKELKRYAEELELELMEPYAPRDKERSELLAQKDYLETFGNQVIKKLEQQQATIGELTKRLEKYEKGAK